MTAFVILAAGRGTRIGRVGESLHKSLVPLEGRAIISHILDLAPKDAHIIIAIGHRGDQIRKYMELAHPLRRVTYVDVPNWDQPGGGPGASLLACRDAAEDCGGDIYFTPCDTLWHRDEFIWHEPSSWMAVAVMPAGTHPARWCRVRIENRRVHAIYDKTTASPDRRHTYVGLGHVARADLPTFWSGIETAHLVTGERQISGGFANLIEKERTVRATSIDWTDVGDEQAYKHAVARYSGYDWTKLGQATYVLPSDGRVVKFAEDSEMITRRAYRAKLLGDAVPTIYDSNSHMLAYAYVPGITVYDACEWREGVDIARDVVEWYEKYFTTPVEVPRDEMLHHAMRFYRDKTYARIEMLPLELQTIALDVVSRVNWDQLVAGTRPVIWHGDLIYGNIIVTADRKLVAIDWREDFDGQCEWGDQRYDIAKLIVGTVVHWGRAQRGDMRPWVEGEQHAAVFREQWHDYWTEVIGALTLINSAPLHAAPLDEIIMARACAWLETLGL